jgi:hexosaminidase
MIKKAAPILFFLLPFLLNAQKELNIIPRPVSLQVSDGSFLIDKNTSIRFNKAQKEVQAAAGFLATYIKELSGYALPFNGTGNKAIHLKLVQDKELGAEGYRLTVRPTVIELSANNRAGLVYGMQSLFQTLPPVRTNAPLLVPAMQIKDYPRFSWRGMHLDVSRHFFSPDFIKEYIDLMATYKLNTFHWHLVDDQGWRIEIKKYPKLTDVGAWRVDKLDAVWNDRPQAKEGEPATYGGYYTQEQIKDIITYAANRNITIVPEIEMPGHVASAIAAYPHLSCTKKAQLPLTGGNYTGMSSNYCAGDEAVFTFLEDVLSEVMALFPSQYIHIGGDEVDKTSWKKCARCHARMKAESLKNEEELQSYFIKRIEKFLISKNRKMIGWDEILEGGLAPEATVMSWRGESGGIQAAKMGHDVVMTPGSPLYFDHYQAGPEGEPIAIGGMNTLKKVYDYNPVPDVLSKEQGKHVLGAQANLWNEFVTTAEGVEYMILPRMLALAEVVWTPLEQKDWNDFNQRLQPHFRAFDQKGLHYSKGNFKVAIQPKSQNGSLQVALGAEALNGKIVYTLDGSDPTASSSIYTHPISINNSTLLKAATVVNGKIMGAKPAEQNFSLHKAIGREVDYKNEVSRYYMADGPNSLTDGVRGTYAVGKYWHGFAGRDLVATIDLGKEQTIRLLTLGCLQHYRDWIFMPQYVVFELSDDGINFKEAIRVENTVSVNDQSSVIKDFTASITPQTARYVRVTAKVLDGCPKGHPGEGKPAWIFADEIIVQ